VIKHPFHPHEFTKSLIKKAYRAEQMLAKTALSCSATTSRSLSELSGQPMKIEQTPNASDSRNVDPRPRGSMPVSVLVCGLCGVLLFDDAGTPRSWAAREIRSFLSRDGIDPNEFRSLSRNELSPYPNVRFRSAEVTQIRPKADGTFEAEFEREAAQACRKILLATGVLDQLPAIPGIQSLFGTSVHQCPCCDGWEMQDRPIAVYATGRRGFEIARAMTVWSSNLMLSSNERAERKSAQATQR
jgi:hypothetical protein